MLRMSPRSRPKVTLATGPAHANAGYLPAGVLDGNARVHAPLTSAQGLHRA